MTRSPPKMPSRPKTGRAPADDELFIDVASLDDHAQASEPDSDDALALLGFESVARADVRLPVEAHVVGEPVTVTAIRYPGMPRAGLVATCRRGDRTYEISFADVVFAPRTAASVVSARYRGWIGLPVADPAASPPRERPHKVAGDDITLGEPVELVVLACKSNSLRCRLLGSNREITLRTAVRFEVPGSIITVMPTKQWTHARHPYLSGEITATRFDAQALGLTPLALHDLGEWDPDAQYWGKEGEAVDEWAVPIIARGKRPMFEMEQIIPGPSPEDFYFDPILESVDLQEAGDGRGAREVLMNLLARDLRCLDAHAHLGNFVFDYSPKQALLHYEMGTAIGALSLGKSFDGVLPWGLIDNRPFLRCLIGAGLCAWRLGDLRAATAVFTKLLWLNPGDNQGARFNLAAIAAGKTWEEMEGDET